MKLLINRYSVMITRGMRGTSVYFEDYETYTHLMDLMKTTPAR
jgi:DUF2075 family protein